MSNRAPFCSYLYCAKALVKNGEVCNLAGMIAIADTGGMLAAESAHAGARANRLMPATMAAGARTLLAAAARCFGAKGFCCHYHAWTSLLVQQAYQSGCPFTTSGTRKPCSTP